eukprot:scaffold20934_cov116-Isochrysis_galbana.AAC.4
MCPVPRGDMKEGGGEIGLAGWVGRAAEIVASGRLPGCAPPGGRLAALASSLSAGRARRADRRRCGADRPRKQSGRNPSSPVDMRYAYACHLSPFGARSDSDAAGTETAHQNHGL